MDRKWTVLEMSIKEYARLIGHSEGYVRRNLRSDAEDRVRIRVATCDLMEDIHDVKVIEEEE